MTSGKLGSTTWLIITIASIGFLFDTYELLMTPLVASDAIAELLDVPLSHPSVLAWTGRLLWITALCGGTFGLLGGWLIDRFGRKTVMAGSIFLYSFSPFLAAYSTTLPWFIFFRSTTFIGVCVEFIAAITWLAEVFEDKKERERWLGITQAFASLGGIIVTLVSFYIGQNIKSLPSIGFPLPPIEGVTTPGAWRWVLATGLFPAIPIALLLPFVPESRVWKEKRAAGTLKRPSITELFAPQYIRLTLVTAMLSACAYGIAFGALQLTPRLIAPGLPEVKTASAELAPLRAQTAKLNSEFDKATPEDKKAIRKQIGALAAKAAAPAREVKELGERVQLYQEVGGLIGRVILAFLIIWGFSRVAILKVFQIPALALLPITYLMFYHPRRFNFLVGLWRLRIADSCPVQLLRRIPAQSVSTAFTGHRR